MRDGNSRERVPRSVALAVGAVSRWAERSFGLVNRDHRLFGRSERPEVDAVGCAVAPPGVPVVALAGVRHDQGDVPDLVAVLVEADPRSRSLPFASRCLRNQSSAFMLSGTTAFSSQDRLLRDFLRLARWSSRQADPRPVKAGPYTTKWDSNDGPPRERTTKPRSPWLEPLRPTGPHRPGWGRK
jgi:hypothetical protein